MTSELASAFRQLRTLAAPLRLRVVPDAEGFPIIPGQHGQIEWFHDEGKYLAAFTTGRLTRGKLFALPGIIRHQIGDEEVRILFLAERLPEVARVLGARRRRSLASEAARKLGARTAYSATSRL